jgi:hypothetical protein
MQQSTHRDSNRFFLLDFPCGVERLSNGNTLIADAGNERHEGSEILEVDRYGQIVWQFKGDLVFPHSTELTEAGTMLIADTANNRVVEVSRDKEIVFDSNSWGGGSGELSDGSHLNYPNDVHRTIEGKLLITDRNNNRIVETNRNGEVLWQYSDQLHHPHNADPLENENVIVADSDKNRIVEVNRDGKVVWSYGDQEGDEQLNWPRDGDRLANGNTLICDSKNSRVLEVDRERSIVWSFSLPYFANFYDADQLENGNILISDQQHQRVIEVDRFGNIVWQFRNYVFEHEVFPNLTNGSFRKKVKSGLPEGWSLFTRTAEGGGEIRWGRDDRDRPCVGVSFDRSGGFSLTQMVSIESGRKYRLAARLKADNIDKNAAGCLQFAFRDKYGGLFEDAFSSPKGQLLNGTSDWIEDSLEAEAPGTANMIEIRILITGPGTIWVNQVMMLSE